MDESNLCDLFRNVGKLKDLKRTGWVDHSIDHPESVADHCFRVAFMAMILGDMLGLDTLKLLKMSLLHDFGEVITGDITPSMNMAKAEKVEAEKNAICKLFADIEDKNVYIELWEEYERGSSPEAKLLKDIDKLEMAIQALEYGRRYSDRDLGQFLLNASSSINGQPVKSILDFTMSPDS